MEFLHLTLLVGTVATLTGLLLAGVVGLGLALERRRHTDRRRQRRAEAQ